MGFHNFQDQTYYSKYVELESSKELQKKIKFEKLA